MIKSRPRTNHLQSLYPIPGSKRSRKYNLLKPSRHHTAICEPFMGGASRSLASWPLPCYLGEIDPAKRAIALAASRYPQDFIECFEVARDRMAKGIDWTEALTYAGRKKSQTHLKRDLPGLYDEGYDRWHSIKDDLFFIRDDETGENAGATMFVLLAAFGNIIRMNPQGTKFNMPWHIDKLAQAMRFCPREWIAAYQSINWQPNVYPSWQEALEAKPGAKTYLLLDPPYCVDGEKHKMTPCYRDHKAGTKQIDETMLALSTQSLERALELGYQDIHLCNYYSDQLADAINQIVVGTSYQITPHMMGKCSTLGNSNGGTGQEERTDGRERPIEWIWEVRREAKSVVSFAQGAIDFEATGVEVAA